MASPLYRVRQFVRGFRPALAADDIALVKSTLTEPQRALFMAMEPRDRRHSVDVARWLLARTPPSADLLVAALLHDVGKGGLRVCDRVAFVLLGPVRLRGRLASPEAGRFRQALWRLQHHAALGAARLDGLAGERAVWLVARHTDASDGGDRELRWLMAADSAC